MTKPINQHLASLKLPFARTVAVPGETLTTVHATLVPPNDPRCGWVTSRFRIGGSVPDGWGTSTTLVLPDAVIEGEEYDGQPAALLTVRADSQARLDELERALTDAARSVVEAHLRQLRLRFDRSVALPGNGGGVHAVLLERLLPKGDPRCGVLTHSFEYGGSVREGWAQQTQLVLVDAVIETHDFDTETNTFVKVRATSAERAAKLERLVAEVAARLASA